MINIPYAKILREKAAKNLVAHIRSELHNYGKAILYRRLDYEAFRANEELKTELETKGYHVYIADIAELVFIDTKKEGRD